MNQCATAFGGVYDAYIERPWLARLIGRLAWGIDVSPMYAAMERLRTVDGGATIADVPCGGGVALRAIGPSQAVRLIAIDIDARMLERTRAKASARGLTQVETIEADMRALPLADASVDLLCTFSGLHMIDEADRAIGEFARVLKPGGEMIGSSFVGAGSRRQRLLFAAGARQGLARPPADGPTIAGWLENAGLAEVEVDGRGFVVFRARKAGASHR